MRRGIKVRRIKRPTYVIDESKLQRYDQEKLIFRRNKHDPNWNGYLRSFEKQGLMNIANKNSGYTRVDYALSESAWTVQDVWTNSYNWKRLVRPEGPSLMGEKWYEERYVVTDVSKITSQVKKVAKFFGASTVGVTDLDPRWIYANWRKTLKPIKIPNDVRLAIVIAVEMDAKGIGTSPECPASAATGLGYSKMAFISSSLSEFIRNLGYLAIPAGNDVGISIPLAIDAGLGQLGRHGLLITPEFGPRVRLCKVFTNLPLKPDRPIDFGVTKFCKGCNLCAEACPVDAISSSKEPSWEPSGRSSNPGALKWYLDGEKCFNYWCDNGTDCSNCVAVCPFNDGPSEVSSDEFWKENGN
jgi:ferredoxin